MALDDDHVDGCAPKSTWLDEALSQFTFIATWRERQKTRRLCAALVALYREFEAQKPDSVAGDRYAQIIERFTGADHSLVIRSLRLAEESFASWPIERPLNLRDIAQYLAVTDGLKTDIAVSGVRSRLVDCVIDTVAAEIPADL